MLRQQPVGTLAIAALRTVDQHACHIQLAILAAPYVQVGPRDFQCIEAHGTEHAPPRHGGRDARQAQRLAARLVAQAHVAEEEIRPHAMPGGINTRDTDRVAQRAAGRPLDIALVVIDIRQDGVAQEQKQHGEGEIRQQHQFDGKTQHMVGGQIGHAIGGTQPLPAQGQWHMFCHACFWRFLHQ